MDTLQYVRRQCDAGEWCPRRCASSNSSRVSWSSSPVTVVHVAERRKTQSRLSRIEWFNGEGSDARTAPLSSTETVIAISRYGCCTSAVGRAFVRTFVVPGVQSVSPSCDPPRYDTDTRRIVFYCRDCAPEHDRGPLPAQYIQSGHYAIRAHKHLPGPGAVTDYRSRTSVFAMALSRSYFHESSGLNRISYRSMLPTNCKFPASPSRMYLS